MKNILLAALLVSSTCFADQNICIRTVVEKHEVCEEQKHAIVGAGLGLWLLGPVAGAIAGSNPNKTCHTVTEEHCEEYQTLPNKKSSS